MTSPPKKKIDWEDAKERIARVQTTIDESFAGQGKSSRAVLKARAKALAQRRQDDSGQVPASRFLIFQMATGQYAIDIEAISAVDAWQTPIWVPDSGRKLLGMIAVRGLVWALFDLASVLEIDGGASSAGGKVLFLRSLAHRVALRVDGIEGVKLVPRTDIKAPPTGAPLPVELLAGIFGKGTLVIEPRCLSAHPAFSKGS